MAEHVAYFYFMNREVEKIRSLIPAHVRYWSEQSPPGYQGGPFRDRSGGLIIFEAEGMAEAERLVEGDPFVEEDVLASRWLKSWKVEPHGSNAGRQAGTRPPV